MLNAWVGKKQTKATRPPIFYHGYHRHRFDIDMDDIRDSLSKLKKDIKHRFGRSKRKGDKAGPGGREESVGSSSSFPRSESRVSKGGGDKQGGGGPDTENENTGASAVKRPDSGSTATSSAKLILRGVRDSADVPSPLKSVAGGLCFILENFEAQYLLS